MFKSPQDGAIQVTDVQLPSDRFLRFHRRQWLIYLLGCSAMAICIILAALLPGKQNPEFVAVPTLVFFIPMIVLLLVERVRRRAEFEREGKRIHTDEWMLRGMNRARGIAMLVTMFAQAPLVFFMSYVPPEPSAAGMAGMTIAIGCGTMAASYLYLTREPR